MQITEIIRKKRDGESLSEAELKFFVDGFTGGKIPDYQASALLMAIFINRLSVDETFWLLQAMLNSGEVVDLSICLLYTSPSPRDVEESRMPSSA